MAVRSFSRLRHLVGAVVITVGAFVLSALLSLPAIGIPFDTLVGFTVIVVLSELGFALAAGIFLWLAHHRIDYFNIRWPTRRGYIAIVAGTVGLLVFRFVSLFAVTELDLPVAGNSILDPALAGFTEILLVLIPISILVIGPTEELLFRGVLQRYLGESFWTGTAIAISSFLFALAHVPTSFVATPDLGAVAVTGVILFGISVILGVIYDRTQNLVVPMLVHGLYDAVLFGAAYVVLTG
ncbi:CPBP family intramembrane glutamic endopeptidase [Haladaptatus sp. YSMS36]|uniref:CPBP family intramembrane glutamic endopeptidase n=1 Tax=Haladaptatus sp. YSMS36 TaxID=3033384 RepID=UPI0023E85809|nr:type II CAAX endopeptidase family protein [Haladaptatus sp. YSMS36]